MEGWVKLHRKLVDWEWYDDEKCVKLLVHLILHCNWEEKKWRGVTVPRGGIITSLPNLSNRLKWGVQTVRTILGRLKSTGEVTVKTTNKYSLITVNNWEQYQGDNTQPNNPLTGNQQATNIQLTTTKEYKELKKERIKEIYITPTKKNLGRVMPTKEEEVIAYLKDNHYKNPEVSGRKFFNFYQAKGWLIGKNPMKDWHAAIRTWGLEKYSPENQASTVEKLREKVPPERVLTPEEKEKNIKIINQIRDKIKNKSMIGGEDAKQEGNQDKAPETKPRGGEEVEDEPHKESGTT